VYTGAFTVRDKRDLSQIYNPEPAAPVSQCSDFDLAEEEQPISAMGQAQSILPPPEAMEMP
jgi:hypothetical protein